MSCEESTNYNNWDWMHAYGICLCFGLSWAAVDHNYIIWKNLITSYWLNHTPIDSCLFGVHHLFLLILHTCLISPSISFLTVSHQIMRQLICFLLLEKIVILYTVFGFSLKKKSCRKSRYLFTISSWVFDGMIDFYIIDGVEGLN